MEFQYQYLLDLVSKGKRPDGRKPDEYRDINIETGVIFKAEGSAKVSIGETQVLAGVKLGIGQPYPDKPDEGVLITGAEFSPVASPEFEAGPPDEDAIELARVVDRGIRESEAIDMKKLFIDEENVWIVFVDIHILNHAGNLIDAAGLAAIAALLTARIPKYEDGKIDYETKGKKLPVKFKPVPVTTIKIGGNLFVDPSLEEENVMETRMTVTARDDGLICAMQKGGSGSLTSKDIDNILDISAEKSKELRRLLNIK